MVKDIQGLSPSYLIIDIGEAETKGIFIEIESDRYTIKDHRVCTTTIGPPNLDASVGVISLAKEMEEKTGYRILTNGNIISPKSKDGTGIDSFLCTSSTGGGLQMVVSGVMRTMTAESARRAVLGAGALLMDIFSLDDDRLDFEKIEQIRRLNPDIFLLAGGTDGGQVEHVVRTAELVNRADPKPRFSAAYKLPIIYAGNIDAREGVEKALRTNFALKITENIRPTLEVENLGPAREAIYNDFMEHVIIHQPGYVKIAKWTQSPIIPTQAAIGEIIHKIALKNNRDVFGVDVGEATLDLYSSFNGVFNRSLNASVGIRYGTCFIMKNVGLDNIYKWLPFDIEENELRNIVANMMFSTQDEKQTFKELCIEQALIREGIKIALEEHKGFAVDLRGVARATAGDRAVRTEKILPMASRDESETFVNMMNLEILIGMGAFTRINNGISALLLIDSLEPEGITEIVLDENEILPHIGILNRVNPVAATEVLECEGLVHLGTCVAPKGISDVGEDILKINLKELDNKTIEKEFAFGDVNIIPLKNKEQVEIEIVPMKNNIDVGRGAGKSIQKVVRGGILGIIVDTRGRPLYLPDNEKGRIIKQTEWRKILNPDRDKYNRIIKSGVI